MSHRSLFWICFVDVVDVLYMFLELCEQFLEIVDDVFRSIQEVVEEIYSNLQ